MRFVALARPRRWLANSLALTMAATVVAGCGANDPRQTDTPEARERVQSHAVFRVTTGRPLVALTFDDGPDPRWTPMVLDVLRQEHVKATFCLIGFMAQRHPELVRAELADGNTLCDHSMHHILNLPARPHSQIIDEVDQDADVIRSITGSDPTFYRPPGGNLSADVIAVAHQRGLRVLKWSIDPRDFTKPPAPQILQRILVRAGPGAVILLHDGGGDRSQTVAMLKALIDQLRAKGFSFYNWQ